MNNKSIHPKLQPAYRLYYVYLDQFGFEEATLNQDQISLVFEKLQKDFLDRAIDLYDLTLVSGHLLQKLLLNVKNYDGILHGKLESALDLEYYLPQAIKDKEWDKIGELFEEIFD